MLMKHDASDEEILAYYRRNHDPYITLESAKKHWRTACAVGRSRRLPADDGPDLL
jgi:hypothetical protein